MNAYLFTIISVSATIAFVVGVVSGVWPVLLIGMGFALLFFWLVKQLHI